MRRHKGLVLVRRTPQNDERIRTTVGCRVMGGNAQWVLVFDKRGDLLAWAEQNAAQSAAVPSHRAAADRMPLALRSELGALPTARTVYDVLAGLSDERLLDETL